MMGYLNPIMQYGFEAFFRKCALTGVDGMIIPDLPFADYMKEYKAIAERNNLKMIMLITPETSEERIHLIDEHTSGFIYMVSSASTTGAEAGLFPPHQRDGTPESAPGRFRHIEQSNLRCSSY